MTDDRLSAGVDQIQALGELAAFVVRKGLADRLSPDVPVADQALIGGVEELEDVIGALEDHHEARRLFEQLPKPAVIKKQRLLR